MSTNSDKLDEDAVLAAQSAYELANHQGEYALNSLRAAIRAYLDHASASLKLDEDVKSLRWLARDDSGKFTEGEKELFLRCARLLTSASPAPSGPGSDEGELSAIAVSLGVLIREWMAGPNPLEGNGLERVIERRLMRFEMPPGAQDAPSPVAPGDVVRQISKVLLRSLPGITGSHANDLAEDLAQALSAAGLLAGQAVPDGFVLVPKEPTEEMLEAVLDASGERVTPYTAPRESGVPIECDISEEDARFINEHTMASCADYYRIMITAVQKEQP